MEIIVRRTRNTLSYIPQYMVPRVPADGVIISIINEHARRPEFKDTQSVLLLTDTGCGLNGSDLRKSDYFLQDHAGKNIYVHCYMGQQRSKWIVENLALRHPEYTVLHHVPDAVLYHGIKG